MQSYDVIIVGAGINGSALAHALHQQGQKVLVLEKDAIASGGSGAAGAFINPKISKAGPLKELIEEAYRFSLSFYTQKFPDLCTQAPLLHIAKYEDDNEKLRYFKANTTLSQSSPPSELKALLRPYCTAFESVYLNHNAILEAAEVCQAMLQGVSFEKREVKSPEYKEGYWCVDEFRAKKIVLTTGAYESVVSDPTIRLRKIYGQRCEVESPMVLKTTMHHEVSVSATKKNGKIAIGASHYLDESQMPSVQKESENLIAMAQKSFALPELSLYDSFRGMRSGSNDYLPIVGPVVDIEASLLAGPDALKGNKDAKLVFKEGMYMINGVGGYGFVLAPYLASMLADNFCKEKALEAYLEPKRFYYRYAKQQGKLK